ncbi:MAG TPA: arginase [Chloroflexota bacterium]|nr:arginase [Chloroflexota bacterium]
MAARVVDIVGVPMDLGADRRGVDMGPYAIRYAGLERDLLDLGFRVNDLHNISVPGPESTAEVDAQAKYLPQIEAACHALRHIVCRSTKSGHLPLVLGGDHSIAIGSIAGLLDGWGAAGVLWVDAHADINTPATSPSGNVHGMPLAVILGQTELFASLAWGARRVDPKRVVLFGIRNLDSGERQLLAKLPIRVFTMSEIDEVGVKAAVEEAIDILQGPGGIHLSVDMDAMDPLQAPGVGTPWPGGLTYREAHLAMELLAASGQVGSIEVVEVNPIADHENQTGKFAEELILSALGRRIL